MRKWLVNNTSVYFVSSPGLLEHDFLKKTAREKRWSARVSRLECTRSPRPVDRGRPQCPVSYPDNNSASHLLYGHISQFIEFIFRSLDQKNLINAQCRSMCNGGCAHYVMVSKFQWKPFWLATHSPWANLKKASGSWLLFQIERAKVWSPGWVENDKRKGFGGVVENCGVQTLSKNRFFWSVRQGRRSSLRLTPFVSISLWFTADSFVISAADVGTWPRWPSLLVKHWSVRVVARKCSGRSWVAEGHFGVLKCACGSHEEFLVLLIKGGQPFFVFWLFSLKPSFVFWLFAQMGIVFQCCLAVP